WNIATHFAPMPNWLGTLIGFGLTVLPAIAIMFAFVGLVRSFTQPQLRGSRWQAIVGLIFGMIWVGGYFLIGGSSAYGEAPLPHISTYAVRCVWHVWLASTIHAGSAGARPSDMARESWSLAPMCGETIVPDPLSWVDLRKTGAETQEAIAMRALEGGN